MLQLLATYSLWRSLTILICIICGQLSCCHAGDHPCPAGYRLELDLSALSYQDERLNADMQGSHEKHCKWLIKVPRLTGTKALVLEGISSGEVDKSRLQYELHDPTTGCSDAIEKVRPGFFCVLPVTDKNTYLSVSFDRQQGPNPNGSKPVVLRAMTPEYKFCSRDMLSFAGNCYAVSPVSENASASMHNILGEAQLAVFSNLNEIKDFIAANNARVKTYPYKRPLNLNQRVRIGLFLNESNDGVISVVKNDTGCGLKISRNQTDIPLSQVSGKCGFLEFNSSGEFDVKFGNCSDLMPALVSFPELEPTRRPVRCTNCSFRHNENIQDLWLTLMQNTRGNRLNETTTARTTFVLVAVLASFLCVSALVAIIAAVKILQRRRPSGTISNMLEEDTIGCLHAESSVSSQEAKPNAGANLLTSA